MRRNQRHICALTAVWLRHVSVTIWPCPSDSFSVCIWHCAEVFLSLAAYRYTAVPYEYLRKELIPKFLCVVLNVFCIVLVDWFRQTLNDDGLSPSAIKRLLLKLTKAWWLGVFEHKYSVDSWKDFFPYVHKCSYLVHTVVGLIN